MLVIVRHAKSSWKTNEPDLTRPLSGRGTRDAVVAGQLLAGLDLDLALISPAARAQQTWQCLQMGGAGAREVRTCDELYHAFTSGVIDVLGQLDPAATRVLLVGHEPTVSDLVLTLTTPSSLGEVIADKFPTSGVAVLSHDGAWSDLRPGGSHLAAFEVPRG